MGATEIFIIIIVVAVFRYIINKKREMKIDHFNYIVRRFNPLVEQYILTSKTLTTKSAALNNAAYEAMDQAAIKAVSSIIKKIGLQQDELDKKIRNLSEEIQKKGVKNRLKESQYLRKIRELECLLYSYIQLEQELDGIQVKSKFKSDFNGWDYTGSYSSRNNTTKTQPNKFTTSQYFKNCKTEDDAKSLYRKLAKKYHPDNNKTGDKTIFMTIKKEYDYIVG